MAKWSLPSWVGTCKTAIARARCSQERRGKINESGLPLICPLSRKKDVGGLRGRGFLTQTSLSIAAVLLLIRMTYNQYLGTLHWANLREAVFDRDGSRCVKCRSTLRIQAHHVIYRKSWFESELEDLITLCRKCHKKEHGINSNPKKPKENQPKRHKKLSKAYRRYLNMVAYQQENRPTSMVVRNGNFVWQFGKWIYSPNL